MTEKDWYSNKDLFEQLQALKDMFMNEVPELRHEMRDTKDKIKKYNGLREELGKIKSEVCILKEQIGTEKEVKDDSKKNWQWTLGWLVALASFIMNLIK